MFPMGTYIYLGSAFGSGGIKGRLGRHLSKEITRPFWHIDYLRTSADVSGYIYFPSNDRTFPENSQKFTPMECLWSQTLESLPYTSTPIFKFGASDCRSGCKAHLIAITQAQKGDFDPEFQVHLQIIQVLSEVLKVSPDEMDFIPHQSI